LTLWRVERTRLFVKSYRKLSLTLRKRTDDAILTLSESECPADFGIAKRGPFRGYLVYEIGRSYRLVYKVLDRQRIILIVVVGDHKTVYGKD